MIENQQTKNSVTNLLIAIQIMLLVPRLEAFFVNLETRHFYPMVEKRGFESDWNAILHIEELMSIGKVFRQKTADRELVGNFINNPGELV